MNECPSFPGLRDLRSLCPGLPRFDRSAVSCPYRGVRLDPFPRGVDPYGVLTPGYQDTTALRSLAPIGAVVLTLSSGCQGPYGVFAPGYQDLTALRSLAPIGAGFVRYSYSSYVVVPR